MCNILIVKVVSQMNSDELKRMSKGFMRKDGKFFLPVTHESLVIDNNGTNIKEKYMLKTDLSIYATEEFVKDYVLRAQLGGSEAVDLSRFAKADHNHDDRYLKLDDAKEAFEKECRNYHDFGGDDGILDNKVHPDRPERTDYDCPICNIFDK